MKPAERAGSRALRIAAFGLSAAVAAAGLAVVVWSGLGGVGRGGATPAAADLDLGEVADFSLVERSGRTLSRSDLIGKVWIAGFVFTHCTGPCPRLTGVMAGLQQALPDDDVRLVSFSVDPERDTPQVLAQYAENFSADPSRWLFLTGPKQDIHRLIRESFRLTVEQAPAEERAPGNEITHSTRLAVVDRRGHVRGLYDGTDPQAVEQLRRKVEELRRER